MGDLGNLQRSCHLAARLRKYLARNEVKVQQKQVWLCQAVVQTLILTLMLLGTPSNCSSRLIIIPKLFSELKHSLLSISHTSVHSSLRCKGRLSQSFHHSLVFCGQRSLNTSTNTSSPRIFSLSLIINLHCFSADAKYFRPSSVTVSSSVLVRRTSRVQANERLNHLKVAPNCPE